MSILTQIDRFINAESLLKKGSRVVVGLSGGADSVALLSVLTELGYDCLAVHCHFGLRGEEADRDAAHAAVIASKLNAGFTEVRFDTLTYMAEKKVSAEMACRDLRYAEFERIRQEHSAEAIAVGHHIEDNIETMFLNLLRGTGLHGVKAMLPKRGHIIRPLLETSRLELETYLSECGLDYIVDSTNACNDMKRNRLRNIVLPALTEAFPDALDSLTSSLANLRGCDSLYRSLLPPMRDSLDGVSPTLLHEWLEAYGFNSDQCEDMLAARTGAQFESATHVVTICPGNRYELDSKNSSEMQPALGYKVYTKPREFKPERGKIYLDYAAAEGNPKWKVRQWQPGDKMKPFGMKGSRMVADILHESGINAYKRKKMWVLTRNNAILWVINIRASSLFPVTKDTEKIIEIYLTDENI